jgi:metal-responsive CopG/Arc/MetJ family transcriptional regulator
MKVKTSITLSEDILDEVDRAAGSESRSTFIEGVLRGFLRRRALNREQDRDREILDRVAEALNEEAMDVLRYQTTWLEGVDEVPEGSER